MRWCFLESSPVILLGLKATELSQYPEAVPPLAFCDLSNHPQYCWYRTEVQYVGNQLRANLVCGNRGYSSPLLSSYSTLGSFTVFPFNYIVTTTL